MSETKHLGGKDSLMGSNIQIIVSKLTHINLYHYSIHMLKVDGRTGYSRIVGFLSQFNIDDTIPYMKFREEMAIQLSSTKFSIDRNFSSMILFRLIEIVDNGKSIKILNNKFRE